VQAAGNPYDVVPAVRQVIRGISTDQPLERAATLEDVREEVLSSDRLNAFVFTGFAGMALLIAVVGVAGVLAFSVSARTREFGVRLAVGSGRANLLARVLSEGLVIATAGIAAGGINTGFAEGALMIIDDHINMLGSNPLVGSNDDRFGPRFPDMTEVYSSRLRHIADDAARARRIPVSHGVYVAVHGPSYETPAEIRALRTIGADAVGMSTVPEAIAARHMGLEVLGISCITNLAAGVLPQPLVHEDVMETARRVRGSFISLLEGIIERV